jgi:hypothetical protein
VRLVLRYLVKTTIQNNFDIPSCFVCVLDAATFNEKGSRSEESNKETRKQGS